MYPSDPANSYTRKLGKAKCSNKSILFLPSERHIVQKRRYVSRRYIICETHEWMCWYIFWIVEYFFEINVLLVKSYKCAVIIRINIKRFCLFIMHAFPWLIYSNVIRLIAWLSLTVKPAKCYLSSLGRRLGLEQKGAETPADHWQRRVWRWGIDFTRISASFNFIHQSHDKRPRSTWILH